MWLLTAILCLYGSVQRIHTSKIGNEKKAKEEKSNTEQPNEARKNMTGTEKKKHQACLMRFGFF